MPTKGPVNPPPIPYKIIRQGESPDPAANCPQLYVKQAAFVLSEATFSAYIGGRGTGKTVSGVWKALKEAGRWRCTGCVVAPTYPMLEKVVLPEFLDLSRRVTYNGIPLLKDFAVARREAIMANNSRVIFASADNPDSLRGTNLSWFWLDEAGLVEQYVWDILIACLREKGRAGRGFVTTTPRGRNWLWEKFVKSPGPDCFVVTCNSLEFPFTSAAFKKNLASQYGDNWFSRQEIEGAFVSPDSLFKPEWFRIEHVPADVEWRIVKRGWDFAATVKEKSDFTCGVKVGKTTGNRYYVLDVVRGKWSWPDAKRIIGDVGINDGYGCNQRFEGGVAMQRAIADELAYYLAGLGVAVDMDHVVRSKDKVSYALPLSSAFQTGAMVLTEGPWNKAYIDEFVTFTGEDGGVANDRLYTNRRHDDQVDATVNAYERLAKPKAEVVGVW